MDYGIKDDWDSGREMLCVVREYKRFESFCTYEKMQPVFHRL